MESKSTINHYIYFDDGLYTGSRARTDLQEIISCISYKSTLEVFYIIACESAFAYTKKIVLEYAEQHGVIGKLKYGKLRFNSNDNIEN